jgi:hypothetical protein
MSTGGGRRRGDHLSVGGRHREDRSPYWLALPAARCDNIPLEIRHTICYRRIPLTFCASQILTVRRRTLPDYNTECEPQSQPESAVKVAVPTGYAVLFYNTLVRCPFVVEVLCCGGWRDGR